MKILAIDPGNTSGFCAFLNPKEFTTFYVEEDLIQIHNEIKERKPDIVVFERFVLYPTFAKHLGWDEMYTSQVIGVIRFTCEYLGIPYESQFASAKDYIRYPENCPFKTEHERDAYGHAWHFYMKQKVKKEVR